MSDHGPTDRSTSASTDASGPAAFEAVDLRVGRIVRAEPNRGARQPAICLWIDFGALGERTSSARIAARYSPDQLIGRLVIAAVNLGSRRIAGFRSEVLLLGLPDADGDIVLLTAEADVPLGGRVS